MTHKTILNTAILMAVTCMTPIAQAQEKHVSDVQGDEKEDVPTWALKPVLITAKRERYTASSGSAAIFGRL